MQGARQKPVWIRFLTTLVWTVLAGACLASGTFLGWAGQSSVLESAIVQRLTGRKPEAVFQRDQLNVLVLGCDEERYYAGPGHKKPGAVLRHASRSDMMLVAHLDFKAKRITGISIPRDLYWEVPGYRGRKINAYHAVGYREGGPERAKDLAREAVEGVVNVPIDRVVVLNFEAFKEMIDMLGGVEVFVPRNMDYDDDAGDLHIHLKKGRQKLSGKDAMGYVRYRHGDSDFKRQDRQKELMLAIKDKALKNWQVGNKLVEKSIELMGHAFRPEEMAALMLFGEKVGGDNVKMDMVPVTEVKGTSDLQLDPDRLEEKLKALHFRSRDVSATTEGR